MVHPTTYGNPCPVPARVRTSVRACWHTPQVPGRWETSHFLIWFIFHFGGQHACDVHAGANAAFGYTNVFVPLITLGGFLGFSSSRTMVRYA